MERKPEVLEKNIEAGNIHFDEQKNTLLLSLEKTDLDLTKLKEAVATENLLEKAEIHITVVGFGTGKEIQKALAARPDKEVIVSAISDLATSLDWRYVMRPSYYLISKRYGAGGNPEERRSCIQAIDLIGLEEFYAKLNGLLGTNFALPFPHVTLLTNSTVEANKLAGIGISSQADFENCSPREIIVE